MAGISRRGFLRGSGAAAASSVAFEDWSPTANFNLDLALSNLNTLAKAVSPEIVGKYTRGKKLAVGVEGEIPPQQI